MRLIANDICKSYAAPVLRGINLELERGEIHGVIGENGAGKSTLFAILAGLVRPESGTMMLDGTDYRPANNREAFRAGVSIATQELSIVETLTVAENLLLRSLPRRFGLVRRRVAVREAGELLDALGLTGIESDTPTASLTLAERQMLEFGKAIARPAALLILDEPTAALSASQADVLHRLMRQQAADGASILYASHRLEDVRRVCDRVSIMRNGRIVQTGRADALDTDIMIETMSGRTLAREIKPIRQAGLPVLEVSGIRTAHLPEPIDLTLRASEIVGVAGLAGAGRSELIAAMFGLTPLKAGSVTRLDDNSAVRISRPRDAVAAGIGLVTEDRRRSGIFAGQSLSFNVGVTSPDRGIIDRARDDRSTRELIERFGVRCGGVEQDIVELSGGNQQKILFGRWLLAGSRIFLLDEPGRGVDVAARHDIHSEIHRLANEGAAFLIASSELEELMLLCDRIVVLSRRRIAATFEGPKYEQAELLAAAFQEHLEARQDEQGRLR